MPKDEWGVKRACPECQVRFYDLNNDPLLCPSCGANFPLSSLLSDKSRPEKAVVSPEPKKAADEADGDADAVVLDDDGDIDVDDDLLETDDDDNVSLEEIADVPSEDDDS